jgi:hypothetical protein
MKLDGVTAEQFDTLEATVNAAARAADGLIFHASGPVEGGWGVLDFWESREQFDRFAAENIGPNAHLVGLDGPPEVHQFPVHEYLPR